MTHWNKIKLLSFLKWASSNSNRSSIKPPKTYDFDTIQNTLRFYSSKSSSLAEKDLNFVAKMPQGVRRKAQVALREYLHSTRGLEYMDAEFISYNSPLFLDNLLKKVDTDSKIEQSMSRLLRYHPINEYEPFFESMGLKPSQYASFLPRDLMYLNDDAKLLENYQVLCNYGIARNEIGRIYTEANDVFKYNYGVLLSKLRALEELGLDRSSVIKIVSTNPRVLIGDTNIEFLNILEKLKSHGIDYASIKEYLINYDSYNWSCILDLLCLLSNACGGKEVSQELVGRNSGFLFDNSGKLSFLLVGYLLKFGYTKNEMCSMFSQVPQVGVKTFISNLRNCYHFLVELDMEPHEIGNIIRSHPILLGSCPLKKLNSLLTNLKTGKSRVAKIVKENPLILKDWVIGLKAEALPNLEVEKKSRIMKTKFLLDLGFVKNSKEFEKAFKTIRGKGSELQERYDCFVKAGINKQDASKMIKLSPRVLNQSKPMIEMKIDFLLNDLGYPLSALVGFPVFVNYSVERAKLRFSMYDWLKKQGRMRPGFTLSTILACSDQVFIKQFVDGHPGGTEVYQKLKNEINLFQKLSIQGSKMKNFSIRSEVMGEMGSIGR